MRYIVLACGAKAIHAGCDLSHISCFALSPFLLFLNAYTDLSLSGSTLDVVATPITSSSAVLCSLVSSLASRSNSKAVSVTLLSSFCLMPALFCIVLTRVLVKRLSAGIFASMTLAIAGKGRADSQSFLLATEA